MKEILIQSLTSQEPKRSESAITDQTHKSPPVLDRRNFVMLGAASMGVLASASTGLAFLPRRQTFVPVQPGPPLQQLPPPGVPLAQLTFEVASGVNSLLMLRLAQDYIAQTLSPDWPGQIVQAQAVQRVPLSFHQQYCSDFSLIGRIPPTRTRFGYFTGVDDMVRSDSQLSLRIYQDLNYFEMRRVINFTEVNQFGMIMYPCSYRLPPTQANLLAYGRVCRDFYGIANPEAYTVLYTRQFTNGRGVFNGYLIAGRNDPLRSPYKDLLIDNIPL